MVTMDLPADSEIARQVLDKARSDDLLIRLSDGTEFVVVAADDFAVEVAQHRANERLMEFLQQRSQEQGAIPLADVRKELGL